MGRVEWQRFDGVPEADLQAILAVGRRRTFRRGEVVFHRGDPADSVHLIRKGRFAIRIVNPLGDVATLSIRGPGEAFGELALLSAAGLRSATVSALEAAETLAVHQIDFARLLRAHPGVNEVLVRLLADQVSRLSDQLVEAHYVDAEKRVLRRLHDLAATYGEVIPLTQEDLAGLAGTSRATVNRVLREEERRGTVTLGRGRTTILDLDALARRTR
jgi:CRP-like cAMP-binding protein